MKNSVIFMVLFLAAIALFPAKPAVLKDISRPESMVVNGDRLFISEGITIFIYDLNDLKLLRKIGKEGEGPKEFKKSHDGRGVKLFADSNRLVVNSEAKLSFFSRGGDFIQEKKVPPFLHLIPVKENYVSSTRTASSDGRFPKLSICLFNKDIQKKVELFLSDVSIGMGADIISPAYNYDYKVYENKIFVSTGKGDISIHVFDSNGKHLFKVHKSLPPMRVDKNYKDDVINFYKTSSRYKNFWDYIKRFLKFQDNFPAVRNFEVDGKKIYVQTYSKKGELFQWYVFDFTGKESASLFLPLGESTPVSSSPFSINAMKYYYLMENEVEEEWEIHVESLK